MSIYVLFMAGFYLTLGLTLLSLHLGAFQDTRNTLDLNQARYIAQTAVQQAKNVVMITDPNWTGTSSELSFGPTGKTVGTYRYTITKTGNIYDIAGTSYIPNSAALKKITETINLRVRNPSPLVLFTDDFESGDLSKWTGGENNDAGTDWSVSTLAPKNGTHSARALRTVAGTTARLISPTFDLSAYDQVVLRFSWRGYLNGTEIRVMQDSGGGFNQIYNSASDSYNAAYIRPAVRLNIGNLTSTVTFRVEAEMGAIAEGYMIDDVELATPYAPFSSLVD